MRCGLGDKVDKSTVWDGNASLAARGKSIGGKRDRRKGNQRERGQVGFEWGGRYRKRSDWRRRLERLGSSGRAMASIDAKKNRGR